jgi:hypothetical protein
MMDARRLTGASLLPERQGGSTLVEIDRQPVPDSWINLENVGRLARWLAPNITSLALGEERPPLPNLPDTPGKVPSTADPRYAEALAEAAMIGSNFVPLPLGGAARVASLVEHGAAMASKRLVSRSPSMYNPPKKSLRPFEDDYPGVAQADATGRLKYDAEGRPLADSALVAGRRVLGGVDEGARPSEYDALATALVGRPASLHPGRTMARDFGHTVIDRYTGQPIEIRLRSDTRPDQLPKVYAHELAEAIQATAGPIPTKGITSELRQIYNTLNNPNRAVGGAEAASWGKPMTPQAHGYKGADIPREYMAEAIRAYLGDPNYIKSVAPNTAARIRERVNAHPTLSRIIQFNSVGAGLFAPLTFPLAGTGQKSEPLAQ